MLPEYSVLCGLITFEIWTHLSLYFCVVVYKKGICQSNTLSRSGRTSHRTYPVSVSPRSQRCKQTPVSTSQASIMGVRFFPLAVFPTISQTYAAEALAISMEAPMGNARDSAEELRLRRKWDNAKVRARRLPSDLPPTSLSD